MSRNSTGEQDHNLQFVRDMLTNRAPDIEGVLTTYRAVRHARRPVLDEERSLVKSHLKLSGVVRRERAALRVGNRIYGAVFDERWIREHLPVNWAGRLRRALRVIAILLALALSLGGLAIYALLQQQEADTQAATALAAQSTAVAAQATSEARRLEAVRQSRIALSRELAANALAQTSSDPQLALLLALEAERMAHTDQAESALRQMLLESQLHTLRGHTDEVRSAAFSPDGKRVVTASVDGSLRLWDARSGAQLAVFGHVGAVKSVRFSPDGARLVTASADGTAQVWDAHSGTSLLILRGHAGSVNEAAFSPDGKLVITAGADGTARIWETKSGKQVALLTGHTGSVKSVAFSPDGTRAVTASLDRTARIYRWELFAPLDDVIARARAYVTRELTCAEQQQYLHTSRCDPPSPTPNTPTR